MRASGVFAVAMLGCLSSLAAWGAPVAGKDYVMLVAHLFGGRLPLEDLIRKDRDRKVRADIRFMNQMVDRIIVDKLSYHSRAPERFEVALHLYSVGRCIRDARHRHVDVGH